VNRRTWKQKRRALPLGLALIGLSAGGAFAAEPPDASPAVSQPQPPAGDAFLGVVIPNSSVDLTSKFEGRLERLDVAVGDAVREGQVLARLDARPLEQELAGAKASLSGARAEERAAQVALAEARDKRTRYFQPRLVKLGVFSQEELEAARFQVQSAEARVAAARATADERQARVTELTQNLAEAALVAPFDGVIAATPVYAGARVAAGQRVLVIQGSGRRKVRFAVPEEQARGLQVGATTKVEVPPKRLALTGRIETVAPEVDAAARMVFAVATFDNDPPEDVSTGEVVRVRTGERAQADGGGATGSVPTRSSP